MPFTLAHPAAVVPISRVLRHRVSLSALLAGSVVPDFGYIPQLPSFGIPSHTMPGAFTFCLPLGLLFYVTFHGIMKRPLIALLPASWAGRVETLEAARRRWPRTSAVVVILSVLIGTATHLAWDSFTHPGPVAERIPFLNLVVFNLEGLNVRVFRLLQHTCTVLGMAALAWWLTRWYRETPERPSGITLPVSRRVLAILAIVGVTSAVSFACGAATAVGAGPILKFRSFLFGAALGGFCGLGLTLLVFSAWWHRFAPSRSDA